MRLRHIQSSSVGKIPVKAGGDDIEIKLTFRQLVGTVLCAAFGVQSSKNHERDFTYGKASTFVAAGIVFSMLFILALSAIVHLVLRQAVH
jgi:hypothetical protein